MLGIPAQLHRKARLRADLLLLFTSIVWGSAFVAQRVAAGDTGVFLFNGLRFLLGTLVLLPLAIMQPPRMQIRPAFRPFPAILVAGLLLFSAGTLQQMGLRYTTAGNAGFISGLYVVLVPIFLALGGRRHLPMPVWLAALLAGLGLFLLSTGGQIRLAWGDALELGGAILFTFHVIWIDRLAGKMEVLTLAIGQFVVTAVLSLSIGLVLESSILQTLEAAWVPILYTGILSIGLGYTLQVIGQQVAPPTDASILLSMEAPFAAVFGWLLLGERLSAIQLAGCGLMLAGMLLAQLNSLNKIKAGQKYTPGEIPFHDP
jgi:drug/metabolite transporter (DMT)-like permease